MVNVGKYTIHGSYGYWLVDGDPYLMAYEIFPNIAGLYFMPYTQQITTVLGTTHLILMRDILRSIWANSTHLSEINSKNT